jgi:hypothetical protein
MSNQLSEPYDDQNAILDIYRVSIDDQIYYCYKGLCDGTPTIWLTSSEWSGRIITSINKVTREITHKDIHGDRIYIFDHNDMQYHIL